MSALFTYATILLVMQFGVRQELFAQSPKQDWSQRFVYAGQDGRLIYQRSESGDRIPDFSHCGYGGGGKAIPLVPAVLAVEPGGADDTHQIQDALDTMARREADGTGFRGAVVLQPGTFRVSGSLTLLGNGVVLRGSGTPEEPPEQRTTILATGHDRRTVIRIQGQSEIIDNATAIGRVTDDYVACGSMKITVDSVSGLNVGDGIQIEHIGTQEWISALGMNRFPARDVGSWLDWKPDTVNVRWSRTITGIDGAVITLDAPLTFGIRKSLSQAVVRKSNRTPLIRHCGIENLILRSDADLQNRKDEDHAWCGISIDNAEDVWVREAEFRGFAGSAVLVHRGSRRVSVMDCRSQQPVSEIGGWRRHTFQTDGQQTLFLRCSAEEGRHDFVTGHVAAGPNAFLDCRADRAIEFSGSLGSWSSGTLFENVTIDGATLVLTNHETLFGGTGWSAANSVLWNCVASQIICRQPSLAENWAIGVWGEFVGDGHWRQLNEFVDMRSLYSAQLEERCGKASLEALSRKPLASTDGSQRHVAALKSKDSLPPAKKIAIVDGQLMQNGQLVAGKRIGTQWWRGHLLPDRLQEFEPGITRFVPGYEGRGLTDQIDQLTNDMLDSGAAVLEHHWGLWYDRRRDDHQVVRRSNGDVWPPFYEQPWARSGHGTAWDGLSRYDLTKFNPWYFGRLKLFADHCDQKGLILIEHMYFQHNVLESAAHWVDFPWRPENCLQNTGFELIADPEHQKRIFLAREFWDVTHPVRRELHRSYIRHCLDSLGENSNVIFSPGEEFTGPATFIEFWLQVISEWQSEHQRDVLISLSCTKDAQDAILANKDLEPLVDIIDVKYWWYTAQGTLYAPPGDQNLSPRQQLRDNSRDRSKDDASLARSIVEYRSRFPDKAVICSVPGISAEAVIRSKGSLPDSIPKESTENLFERPLP